MPLGAHLEELRRRIFFALVGLVPLFVFSMAVGQRVEGWVIAPLQRALSQSGVRPTLLATGVMETFNTYIRVSLILTLILGAPWILWQLWLFVRPGLFGHERRFLYILLPLGSVLAAAGVAFLYYVLLPIMLAFFVSFGMRAGQHPHAPPPAGTAIEHVPALTSIAVLAADPVSPKPGQEWVNTTLRQRRVCVGVSPDGTPEILGSDLSAGNAIEPHYRIGEFISFFTTLALAFAAGFQMPLAVLILGWAGVVAPAMLRRYRRHALFVCAIVAALLTPSDPLSMLVMMAPLYVLYELGILLLVIFPARRPDERTPEEAA